MGATSHDEGLIFAIYACWKVFSFFEKWATLQQLQLEPLHSFIPFEAQIPQSEFVSDMNASYTDWKIFEQY